MELAGSEILLRRSPARITPLFPYFSGSLNARMIVIRFDEKNTRRRLLSRSPSGLPLGQAEALADMGLAIPKIVAGETVNDKAR
jgi:hypothetical protein